MSGRRGPRAASPSHAPAATAGATSSTALAAPAADKKRTYLLIQNVADPGGGDAWIRVDGSAATAAAPCIRLAPGVPFGGTENVIQGKITCIRDGGSDVPLSVVYEEVDR